MPIGVYTRTPKPLAERFWAKVDKNGPTQPHMTTPCWVWTGATVRTGYGQIRSEGVRSSGLRRIDNAHRISYVLAFGSIPDDKPVVMHRCDNPPCVRPDHLLAGTRQDNIDDCVAKGRHTRGEKQSASVKRTWAEGRHARGERCAKARLSAAMVVEIRSSSAPAVALARRFAVAPATVSAVRNRKSWKHVE